jgi:hypothetical protein
MTKHEPAGHFKACCEPRKTWNEPHLPPNRALRRDQAVRPSSFFGFIGSRRRLPPTPRERAQTLQSADLCRGIVRAEALTNERSFCFAVCHYANPFGDGSIVDHGFATVDEAESAALEFARSRKCLFAPSWFPEAAQ